MSNLDIPKSWASLTFSEAKELGLISDIQDGNHGEIHPKASDYTKSGIPFVMANNISNGRLNIEGVKFISKKQADSLRIGFAKEGDVLLTHKGTIGQSAVVEKLSTEYIMLTPQVTYYRLNSKYLLPKFLSSFFKNPNYQSNLRAISKQTTRDYVGITKQATFQFPLPPLGEQVRIVEKIEITQEKIRIIAQSVTKAERLIEHLALSFLKIGLAAENQISDSYEERSERYGRRTEDQTPMVGVSNELGVVPLRSESKVDKTKYKWVYKGDVFYNPMRLNVGSVALYQGNAPAITSPDYVVVKPKEYASGWLLFHFLKSKSGQGEIAKRTKGSVRERVYFDNMATIPFYRISPQESEHVVKSYEIISLFATKISHIKTLISSLTNTILQRAFEGKLVLQDSKEGTFHDLLEKLRTSSKSIAQGKKSMPRKKRVNQ